jgi:hypothetical protein
MDKIHLRLNRDGYDNTDIDPKEVVVTNDGAQVWLGIPNLPHRNDCMLDMMENTSMRVLLEYHVKYDEEDKEPEGWYLYVYDKGDEEDPQIFRLTQMTQESETDEGNQPCNTEKL